MPAFNSVGSYLTKGSLTTLQYYPIYGNCCSSIKSVARILPLRKKFPFSNCPREELEQKAYTSQQDVLQCVTTISVCRPLSPFLPFTPHCSLSSSFQWSFKAFPHSLQLGKNKCWQSIGSVCLRGNSPTLGYALSKLCHNICMLLYCKVCCSTPQKTSQLPWKSAGFLLKSNCWSICMCYKEDRRAPAECWKGKEMRALYPSLFSIFLNSADEKGASMDCYDYVRFWSDKTVWVEAVVVLHKWWQFLCNVASCKCEPFCLLPFLCPHKYIPGSGTATKAKIFLRGRV